MLVNTEVEMTSLNDSHERKVEDFRRRYQDFTESQLLANLLFITSTQVEWPDTPENRAAREAIEGLLLEKE